MDIYIINYKGRIIGLDKRQLYIIDVASGEEIHRINGLGSDGIERAISAMCEVPE